MNDIEQFDAESPADPAPYIACGGCGADSPEKRCIGCMHIFGRKVTTSPERVQIPAESKHDAPLSDAMQWGSALGKRACDQLAKEAIRPYDHCPKCTAHMPVGKACGGTDCGLKE